ncbi:MAG: hypothetical protein LAP13_06120, partial [Acidobacteriia bacterium]|nr:hypothetical protein [Terriglobia bacterium]
EYSELIDSDEDRATFQACVRTLKPLADNLVRLLSHRLRFANEQIQALCTLARELPNLSLAGYWWLNFFPSVMRQVMEERLDMLPTNKQVGFFSDAYCVDWTYAKAKLVRKQLAIVLAQKVEQGQFTRNEALEIARAILFETPQQLLRMRPAEGQAAGARLG